ncbi:MAG: hypothetical protein ACI3W5_07345, partial [Faecousia sp.]
FGITDSSGLMPLSRIWDNGVINNGRRGEEQEKAKPSIRERLEDAKRECAERKPSEKGHPGRSTPEHGDL